MSPAPNWQTAFAQASQRQPAEILYMAAMGPNRSKGGKPLYNAIRERRHSSTTSFNILARRLAGIAWGTLKSGRDFNPVMMKVDQA